MGFIDDIVKVIGKDFAFGADFVCTFTSDAGYFEKITGIIKYSDDEIVLSIKNGSLTVTGRGLYVKKYCEGDVAICGKITGIKRD